MTAYRKSADIASHFRAIYERNLEERFIHRNLDHPSPRFFLAQQADGHWQQSLSSIPKASKTDYDLNQLQSLYNVIQPTPQGSHDLRSGSLQSMNEVRASRKEKTESLNEYQRHNAASRA